MTILTAHSGADGLPDNSLAFVRYALTTDADALEVDVRRAPSGELRLGHDEADSSLPTLAEVFGLLRKVPDRRINCDLKEQGLEETVCELARKAELEGRPIQRDRTIMFFWARATLKWWVRHSRWTVLPSLTTSKVKESPSWMSRPPSMICQSPPKEYSMGMRRLPTRSCTLSPHAVWYCN